MEFQKPAHSQSPEVSDDGADLETTEEAGGIRGKTSKRLNQGKN